MYSKRLNKKITDKLQKDYNIECYSGATSYLFNKSHELMEKKLIVGVALVSFALD